MTDSPKSTAKFIGRKWDELDDEVRRSGLWRRLPNTVNDEFHTPDFVYTVGLYGEIVDVRPVEQGEEAANAR